jgi:sugar lactone lactonase YvrE
MPSGAVSTLAGNGDSDTVDGTGAAANFYNPTGADVDSSGNLFVADTSTHLIRKITPAGVVTTFAGTGGAGSVDATGTSASFSSPRDIVIDSNDNLFVADYGNHTIRKITTGAVVTTFAGGAGVSGSTNATGGSARFNNPSGLGIDSSDNLYVADTANHIIRKITTGAVVTTLAGTAASANSTNGTGAAARFSSPMDIVMANAGDLYVTDSGNATIRKVTTGGVAGNIDATGISARFTAPAYISVDGNDNLYVTDNTAHTIRKVTLAGVVTTISGSADDDGFHNAEIYRALYSAPSGITLNTDCDILVADNGNHSVRKIVGHASGCTAPTYRRRIMISSYLRDLFKLSKNRTLINHQVR